MMRLYASYKDLLMRAYAPYQGFVWRVNTRVALSSPRGVLAARGVLEGSFAFVTSKGCFRTHVTRDFSTRTHWSEAIDNSAEKAIRAKEASYKPTFSP